ncbi:MAG: hypothetical protein ABR497_00185, partial [Kiritimatiellia bacterium]
MLYLSELVHTVQPAFHVADVAGRHPLKRMCKTSSRHLYNVSLVAAASQSIWNAPRVLQSSFCFGNIFFWRNASWQFSAAVDLGTITARVDNHSGACYSLCMDTWR